MKQHLSDKQLSTHSFFDSETAEKFLTNAPVFVIVVNYEGVILDISRTLPSMDKSDVIGRTIFEFGTGIAREELRQRLKRVSEKGGTEAYSFTFLDPYLKSTREFYSTMVRATGSESEVHIYASDISGLANIEGSLRNTEAKYKYLMEAATDGLITVDPFLKIVDVNISAIRLLGAEGDEIIHRSLFNFISPEQFEKLPEMLERLKEGETLREEFHIETKDEKKVIVDLKINKLPNGNFLLLFYDVTYKLFQEDIAEKTKNKIHQYKRLESLGVLAGGMAHEFNNILTPIMGYSELLYSDEGNTDVQKKNIEQIIQGARRAKELVEQILVFSRKKDTEKHKLDIHIIVKESIKLLRSSTPKEITLNTHIENCSAIEANPSQIQQVIIQLASNALTAMGTTKGVLDIVLKNVQVTEADGLALSEGTYILLKVSDTGKGIDQSIIDRVFDPFFTTNDIGEGSGMGLSIVHGIVQSHNAEIFVDSKPKMGTTFSIYFPVKSNTRKSPKMGVDAATGSSSENSASIMIVDDEIEVVNLFEILLKRKGYSVFKFTNPIEALREFKASPQKYNLIITDQTMPDMVGIDFSKEVGDVNNAVPVLLLTGFSDILEPEELSDYNIADVLIKPVVPAVFYETIQKILSES